MPGPIRIACTCLLAGALTSAWAGGAIYVCVDAKGRRLTSDRPIAECAEREQKDLNANGTVRRIVPPTPTAAERAAGDQQQKKDAEERLRQAEQQRLQKLLVARYPNQAAHDADRARSLRTVQDAVAGGQKRIADLQEQRRKLDLEAAAFKKPEQVPPELKLKIEDNDHQFAAQQRFVAAQEDEKLNVARRFDDELARLKPLWAQQTTAANASAAVNR
jgi:hypothetical protein